jgi:hypothetical protein
VAALETALLLRSIREAHPSAPLIAPHPSVAPPSAKTP